MTNKLLEHFKRMQGKAAEYIQPGPYNSAFDTASAAENDMAAQDNLFVHDMIYALDGPEQREAEAEASFDYIAEANCTLSNQFHGEKVTMAAARDILDNFIKAGQELDKLKKALFYGRGDDIGLTRSRDVELMDQAPNRMIGIPYATGELDPVNKAMAEEANVILHALIGIATEGVEGVEALYKALFGNEPIDKWNVLEESGDAFWYHGVLFKVLGSDFDTEQRRNIAKLRERFPAGFTEYDANNRNLAAERAILEAGASPLTDPDVAALIDGDTVTIVGIAGSISEHAVRFAKRCADCGLDNGQHRPDCLRPDSEVFPPR